MCLPKAICLGLAFLRRFSDGLWRSVSRSNNRLTSLARKLMRRAKISKTRDFGLAEIEMFQSVLRHVQLVVFDDRYQEKPLFVGPYRGEDCVVGIRLQQNHYDHIKRIGPYLGSLLSFFSDILILGYGYFCSACLKKYNTPALHYRCKVQCKLCLHRGGVRQCEGIHSLKCETCEQTFQRFYGYSTNALFSSVSCYNRHLEKGLRDGKSPCEQVERCPDCRMRIFKRSVCDQYRKVFSTVRVAHIFVSPRFANYVVLINRKMVS